MHRLSGGLAAALLLPALPAPSLAQDSTATIAVRGATILPITGPEIRKGVLEVGKDGDLALFDGDPFEYVTHVLLGRDGWGGRGGGVSLRRVE
jgi:hypothetical protein